MRETCVVSHVTLAMSSLVVMLGCVRAMGAGMVLTPSVIKVATIQFVNIHPCLSCIVPHYCLFRLSTTFYSC